MPCSPVIVPPSARARSKSSSHAASARAWSPALGRDEEARVQVPVAGVPPAHRLEAVPGPDLGRPADRVGQPVDGDGDVLGELAAADGGDAR